MSEDLEAVIAERDALRAQLAKYERVVAAADAWHRLGFCEAWPDLRDQLALALDALDKEPTP